MLSNLANPEGLLKIRQGRSNLARELPWNLPWMLPTSLDAGAECRNLIPKSGEKIKFLPS